jgi:hypothetical protein
MNRRTIIAGIGAGLIAVAATRLPHEALAGRGSPVRKDDTKRMGKGKRTFTPPNPVLPPNPIVPPSPIKR